MKQTFLIAGLLFFAVNVFAQKTAPKPVYDDPVYHGAADPVIVYNKAVKKWWMFFVDGEHPDNPNRSMFRSGDDLTYENNEIPPHTQSGLL